ncbi:hypothetical protein JIN85_06275 [Luteolibacter pohnpeiensis]|uniref:Uncharacterized protein n=1 Tax=Luteolibacter pohnpeiensis TaxID=454153 RepID=A0A934S519_9BACT|nr:hypothetical protein [Luteolibacter pohnpeiensis]MBK1882013.1 hypothetical protein [Luteolibacter pohnpeiensis]
MIFLSSSGEHRRFGSIKDQKPHVESKLKDGSTWRIWYIMLGTRSEGIRGELVAPDGSLIVGEKLDEKKNVQGVVYVWKGSFKGRKNLFDNTGWLHEKLDEYSPSRKVIEKASK